MANIFTIKHGAAKPVNGTLEPYELGFADNGGLFIGGPNKETIPVSVQVAENNNGGKFVYYSSGKFQASDLLIIPSSNIGPEFPTNPVKGQVFFIV